MTGLGLSVFQPNGANTDPDTSIVSRKSEAL